MTDGSRSGSITARLGDGTPGALVVEDEPDIVAFLGAFFRASGLRLEHIDPTAPEQVIDAAVERQVGCILLDMNLRGTTGFEVLTAIRADPRLATIPVLIVSANDSLDVQRRALALGANEFVAKPFRVKHLFDTVAGYTNGGESAFVTVEDMNERIMDASDSYPPGISLALLRVLDPTGSPLPLFALQDIESRLRDALPAAEIIGVTAPDEIAVIFPTSAPSALGALDRMRVRFNEVVLTAGLASFPGAGRTADELYMAADVALAEALEDGSAVAFHH